MSKARAHGKLLADFACEWTGRSWAERGLAISAASTGITEATYYVWKKKHAGLGLSELTRAEVAARGELKAQAAGRRWTGTCCRRSYRKKKI